MPSIASTERPFMNCGTLTGQLSESTHAPLDSSKRRPCVDTNEDRQVFPEPAKSSVGDDAVSWFSTQERRSSQDFFCPASRLRSSGPASVSGFADGTTGSSRSSSSRPSIGRAVDAEGTNCISGAGGEMVSCLNMGTSLADAKHRPGIVRFSEGTLSARFGDPPRRFFLHS